MPITDDMKELLQKFEKKFSDIYDFLYNTDYVPAIHEQVSVLAKEFDETLRNDEDFRNGVGMFGKYRQDIITSDREAAAYMLATYYMY